MAEQPLASIWSRFLAMIIDCIVLILPGFFFNFAFPIGGPILLAVLYFPIFHASPIRATPGKRAMNLQVVTTKGETVGFGMALLRLIFAGGSFPFFLLGHCVAFLTEKKQAVHDLVADTIVVKGRNDSMTTLEAWKEEATHLFKRLS